MIRSTLSTANRIFLLLTVVVITTGVLGALPATMEVNSDGSFILATGREYTSIAAAISMAQADDVIEITNSGLYTEPVSVSGLTNIELRASEGETPIIYNTMQASALTISTGADGFTAANLIIYHQDLMFGYAAVSIQANGVTLSGCRILVATTMAISAVEITSGTGFVMDKCHLTCEAGASQVTGVRFWSSTADVARITNNIFASRFGPAVTGDDGVDLSILNNTIYQKGVSTPAAGAISFSGAVENITVMNNGLVGTDSGDSALVFPNAISGTVSGNAVYDYSYPYETGVVSVGNEVTAEPVFAGTTLAVPGISETGGNTPDTLVCNALIGSDYTGALLVITGGTYQGIVRRITEHTSSMLVVQASLPGSGTEYDNVPFILYPVDLLLPEDGSPYIDAGDDAVVLTDTMDILGLPRRADGNGDSAAVVDIGAVEYPGDVKADSGFACWHVNPETGSDGNPGTAAQPFRGILAAITAAADGDTVKLAAYTFSSGIVYQPAEPLFITKSGLVITGGYEPDFSTQYPGWGSDSLYTIISGSMVNGAVFELSGPVSGVSFDRMIFVNAEYGGIRTSESSQTGIQIGYSEFWGSDSAAGIRLENGNGILLQNVLVDHCDVGIEIVDALNVMITNATVASNRIGIRNTMSYSTTLHNSIIAYNREYGVYENGSAERIDPIQFNSFYGNGVDLYWSANDYSVSELNTGNNFENAALVPGFQDTASGNYWLLPSSECVDAGDTLSAFDMEPEPNGGRIDLGMFGNTPAATVSGGSADSIPPYIVQVDCSIPFEVAVVFDGPLDRTSAETIGNYSIAPGMTVSSATLQPDLVTVVLQTAEHDSTVQYSLTLNNIADTDGNVIEANTSTGYWFVPVSAPAGPGLLWEQTYGGWHEDYMLCMDKTAEGNYIAAGPAASFGLGANDFWFILFDENGDTIWNRVYGTPDTLKEEPLAVIQTTDGGYLSVGKREANDSTISAYMVKIGSGGAFERDSVYADSAIFYGVAEATDGYVMAGMSGAVSGGVKRLLVIKTDFDGNQLWRRDFGGQSIPFEPAVVVAADDGIIVAYDREVSDSVTHTDISVMKLSATGDSLWEQSFGAAGNETADEIIATSDGIFLIAGATDSEGEGGKDAFLAELDAAGFVLWLYTYGTPDDEDVWDVVQTADGGYLAAGVQGSFTDAAAMQGWMVKIDSLGSEIWSQDYGKDSMDIITGVAEIGGGDIFFVGATKTDADMMDAWVARVGNGSVSNMTPDPYFSPDPASGPFAAPLDVFLHCPDSTAFIYYTTDGRDPDSASNVYTSSPISLPDGFHTIRAYARTAGMDPSNTVSAGYDVGGGITAAPFTEDSLTTLLLHFDEGGGDTAYDASGRGNHAVTDNQSVWIASGMFGSGLYFGAGEAVTVMDNGTDLDMDGSFTIDMWVRMTTQMGTPVQKGSDYPSWRFDFGDGASFWAFDDVSNILEIYWNGMMIDDDGWHWLKLVIDRDRQLAYTIGDGVVRDSADISGLGNVVSGSEIVFGSRYTGYLDEFRIVKEARYSEPAAVMPAAVTGLQVTGSTETQVSLSWDPNPVQDNVVYYLVSRDGGYPDTAYDAYYNDYGVSAGMTYEYMIMAVNDQMMPGMPASVSATTPGGSGGQGSIGGTVTYEYAVENLYVVAVPDNRTFVWDDLENRHYSHTRPDMDGNYYFEGLDTGPGYKLLAIDLDRVTDPAPALQWYNGQIVHSVAQTVVFDTAGGTELTGIDFALEEGGTVSGTLKVAGDGRPVNGYIHALTTGGEMVAKTRADHTGAYELGGLPAGIYVLYATGESPDQHLMPGYYPDKADLASAQTVTVAAADVAAGMSILLTEDFDEPYVVSTNPSSAALAVVNGPVTIVFSEAMDTLAAGQDFRIYDDEGTPVHSKDDMVDGGSITWPASDTMVFTPSAAFHPAVYYRVEVSGEDQAGNRLEDNSFWFITAGSSADTLPPNLTSVFPADGMTDVTAPVIMGATVDKLMDPATVSDATVILDGGAPVIVYYEPEMSVLVARSRNPLSAGTHTLEFTTGIKDASGNPLAAGYVSTFTITGTDPVSPRIVHSYPNHDAARVPVDGEVRVIFDKMVDVTTMSLDGLTVTYGADTLPTAAAVSVDTAHWGDNPFAADTEMRLAIGKQYLVPGTRYTLAFGSGFVSDLQGNALQPYSLSFTLADTTDDPLPFMFDTDIEAETEGDSVTVQIECWVPESGDSGMTSVQVTDSALGQSWTLVDMGDGKYDGEIRDAAVNLGPGRHKLTFAVSLAGETVYGMEYFWVADGTPEPVSPAGDTVSSMPALQWTGTADALWYGVMIMGITDPSYMYMTLYLPQPDSVQILQITENLALAEGQYAWRIMTLLSEDTEQGMALSAPAMFTVAAGAGPALPSAPTGLSASPGVNIVTLSWNANPAAENVTGYMIYKSGPSGTDTISAAGTATSLTDPGLTAGTYSYGIAAVNAAGTGPRSTDVTATVAAIQAALVRIDISPADTVLLHDGSVQFTATGYDAADSAWNGLAAAWSITDTDGSITGGLYRPGGTGLFMVTASYAGSSGDTVTGTVPVTVRRNMPPVITIDATFANGETLDVSAVRYTVTANDTDGGMVTPVDELTYVLSPVHGGWSAGVSGAARVDSMLPAGTYTLMTAAADAGGNADTATLTFTVRSTLRPLTAGAWQMGGVPHKAADRSVEALFGASAAVFRWDESRESDLFLLKYARLSDNNRQLDAGQAAWVFSDGSHTVDLTGTGYLPADTTVTIPLAAGWNQISNPFSYGIRWRSLSVRKTADGSVVPLEEAADTMGFSPLLENTRLYWYDGTTYDWSDDPVFLPWQGYFVRARQACEVILAGPAAAFKTEPVIDAIALQKAGSTGWSLRLEAWSADKGDIRNYIGEDAGAYRAEEPLGAFGTYAAVAMVGQGSGRLLAADIRKACGTDNTWTVQVDANTGEPVRLNWEMSGVPGTLYLIDPDAGTVTDMLDADTYEKASPGEVVITTAAPASAGYQMAVRSLYVVNRPNPFRAATVFTWRLPAAHRTAAAVRLIIYDRDGQPVDMLNLNGASGGSAVWQSEGRTGLYFYRLHTDTGFDAPGRMLIAE